MGCDGDVSRALAGSYPPRTAWALPYADAGPQECWDGLWVVPAALPRADAGPENAGTHKIRVTRLVHC
jgi:hypothetical protein